MDLCSVVPNSTPPCFVNSQLVSLPRTGMFNKFRFNLQYLSLRHLHKVIYFILFFILKSRVALTGRGRVGATCLLLIIGSLV